MGHARHHDRMASAERHRKWSTWSALGLAAGLVLLAGCGLSSTPGGATGPTSASVTTDKTAYAASEAIVVTITNGLTGTILVPDHQTNCTIISLELLVGQNWQRQNPCRLMSPTRLIEVRSGATSVQTLQPQASGGAAGWQSGTYRVTLTYHLTAGGAGTVLSSATFTVS